ncbi:hypothetical protein ACFWZT_17725 [Streptomyces alboflavus]
MSVGDVLGDDVKGFCGDLIKESRTHADVCQESLGGKPGTAGK